MSTNSILPAIAFGKQNVAKVKQVFAKYMFNIGYGLWLYDDAENVFRKRDLGYCVGYAIAEGYYSKAKDTSKVLHIGTVTI